MGVVKRKKRNNKGFSFEVNFTYKDNGITKRYFKGGFPTKKEALNHEIMMKAQVQEKGTIKKEVKKTFEDVYNEFLENGTLQYQQATIHNTTRYYNDLKSLCKIPIKNFDYQLLQNYFNSRKDKGIETNRCIKKAIGRVLNYAIKVNYIENNPLSLVVVSGIDNHMEHEQILNENDFIRLVDVLNDQNNFKYQAYAIAIQIAYYTGLRISEVLALHKDDIDLENDIIIVNKKLCYMGLKKDEFYATHQMKSKKSKSIIPVTSNLKQALIKWFKINPYDKIICDEDNYYINPNILSSNVKKIARPLGIDFHFHMLRHTFITNLVTNNIDVKTVQELARHSNINTTMSIYTHIQDKHKKSALNSVFSKKCGKNVGNANIGNLQN